MNKMNLPPPFEEDAIPGRFSLKLEQDAEIVDEQKRHPKRRRTDEIPIAQIVEEEEDEDDDDDTHPVADMDHSNIQHVEVSKPLQSNGKGIEPLSLKAGRNLSDLPEDNSRPPVILLGRQSKLSSIKKSATLGGAFQVGAQNENKHEAHQSTRPGVISKTELERQRLAPEGTLCVCEI
ncbi:unnamed protein product [Phytophthora lilii]|uniref:Unnamed protein product n=1 Tax=Phytophthora lilii TaxID=2077276 RepID=A0A9W6TFX9_9STRA|nr:unnamed protein product [Phytophthora lilii]